MPDTVENPNAFDPNRNYNDSLNDDEIKIENGRPFVFLKGLERLAKERGVRSAKTVRLDQISSDAVIGFICTYEYTFDDGRTYQGSADATSKNCDGNFRLYLTAMAESRAKARALRTAFAITTCSWEEKSNATYADDPHLGKIGEEQIMLIRKLATQHSIGKSQLFELMDIPRIVKDINELTRSEAIEIISGLNKMSKPKRRATKKKLATNI